MAFDFGLWSDGASPLLFVCEEAHRYAPADSKIGFGPTRRALSRIAKEGRKYGVFLGLVTQRPAEIDPTIISQCTTLFVMRLSNDRDQALIRSAVSDAAANLLTFIPSLGTGEVFAFGAGVALPTRMRFNELPVELRPNSEAGGSTRIAAGASPDRDMIETVIDRWRSATMSKGRSTIMAAKSIPCATTSRPRARTCRGIRPRRDSAGRGRPGRTAAARAPAFEPSPSAAAEHPGAVAFERAARAGNPAPLPSRIGRARLVIAQARTAPRRAPAAPNRQLQPARLSAASPR